MGDKKLLALDGAWKEAAAAAGKGAIGAIPIVE